MAELFKEKTHKRKDGTIVTNKYRIDADFVPSKVADICEEFIQNYCDAKNEAAWLTERYNNKDSFMSIRKDFVTKFFPKIIKGKEESNRQKWLNKHK